MNATKQTYDGKKLEEKTKLTYNMFQILTLLKYQNIYRPEPTRKKKIVGKTQTSWK